MRADPAPGLTDRCLCGGVRFDESKPRF